MYPAIAGYTHLPNPYLLPHPPVRRDSHEADFRRLMVGTGSHRMLDGTRLARATTNRGGTLVVDRGLPAADFELPACFQRRTRTSAGTGLTAAIG